MKKEAQIIWLRGLQKFGCFVVLVALAMSVGCGGGEGANPDAGMSDDEKQITNIVSSVSDLSGNLERLRAKFTKDAAPSSADAKKMTENKFRVNGDITVTGTTASFPVEITTYGETSTTSEQTWKATKEGEEWKISDAPL